MRAVVGAGPIRLSVVERKGAGGSHAAARTVVVWDVLRREIERAAIARPRLTVVDVGGGTGGFAVPLAQAGHDIIVVDPSPDALAALSRRAAEAGVGERIQGMQGDADSLATLVGPRPPLPTEVAWYDQDVARRLLVKPGMTGLWQVSGRSDLSWEDGIRLDLYYVENWSLATDVTILWKTFGAVAARRGAY